MASRDSRVLLDMLVLDRSSGVPMHRQLYNVLRDDIMAGRLKADTRLPATRALADELGVSRNTVITAYDALLAEGYLDSRVGSGSWVARLPRDAIRDRGKCPGAVPPTLSARGRLMTTQPRDRTTPGMVAFHPGYPEIAQFPFSTWARLIARHTRHAREDLFGYHLVAGHPRLQEAIADYLAASRGVRCAPEQVVVVSGAQAGLDLIGRLLMDEGDHFWMEEPGYLGAHNAFLAAGGQPAPLRVDGSGWDLESPMPPPRLVFVTPSCQWPLGRVMQMDERLRLLQIAERHNAWIVEDDYDSEYRLRGQPIPAMQGLDRSGRVIYLGTFAKTMFPSLRIGFLVVPLQLVEGVKRAVSNTGHYPPLLTQVALADFIIGGYFATHLRRMRRLYAQRQGAFIEACDSSLGNWLAVEPADTGMQVIGRFRRAMDDGVVLEAALRNGVDFSRLSAQYRHGPPEEGALLGYAGVDEAEALAGIARLATTFRELDAVPGVT